MRQHSLSGKVFVPLHNFTFHSYQSESHLTVVMRIRETLECINFILEVMLEDHINMYTVIIPPTLSAKDILMGLHFTNKSTHRKRMKMVSSAFDSRHASRQTEAIEYAIDHLICRIALSFSSNIEKINELKHLIWEFRNGYTLLEAKLLLNELIKEETEHRFFNKKAKIIQQKYRFAILDPYCKLCSSRLMHELEDLNNVLAQRW